jgi:hypothetical protein
MTKWGSIVLASILLVIVACGDGAGSKAFVATEIGEAQNVRPSGIVLEKSVSFLDISYPSIFSNNEFIYIYGFGKESDAGKEKVRINKYDVALNLLSVVYIPVGQGPGDLGAGPVFSGCGDQVYVSDNTQRRISVFDSDLNYMKLYNTKNHLYSTQMSTDGSFLVCAMNRENHRPQSRMERLLDCCRLTLPDLDKTRLLTHGPFSPFDEHTKKIIVGKEPGYHFFLKNNHFYYLDMAAYEITKISMDGKIQKKIKVNTTPAKVPEAKRAEWLKAQLGRANLPILDKCSLTDTIQPASWMIPLEKGFAVIRRNSYDTDCDGPVQADYFNYNLDPICKTDFPCFTHIFTLRRDFFPRSVLYAQNALYTIIDTPTDYKLKKWKISLERRIN